MANTNSPFGLIPINTLVGGQPRINIYPVKASTTIYKGDLLAIDSGGGVTPSAAGGSTDIGVAMEYVDNSSGGLGDKMVAVADDPHQEFLVQAYTGTAVAATDMFATCDILAGSGSATTKLSGHVANMSALNSGATQLLVLRKYDVVDNEWGDSVRLVVLLNAHVYHAFNTAGQ